MENIYMLLSPEDTNKELFNAQDFNPEVTDCDLSYSQIHFKTTNRFIFYFMQLLQFAFELDLISESIRDGIANNLLVTADFRADSKTVFTTNYLYITTLWLQSMSNWDAWLKLQTLTTTENANDFLTSAFSWFLNKLKGFEKDLEQLEPTVISFNDQSILNSYYSLKTVIQDTAEFKFDLKAMHKSHPPVPYSFLGEIKASNWLERLQNYVNCFCMELTIMSKIDAKFVIEERTKDFKRLKILQEEKASKIQNAICEKLNELEKSYQKKLENLVQNRYKNESFFAQLEKEFAEEHPELSGIDFDYAFEEYIDEMSLAEEFSVADEDENSITDWYEKHKDILLSKLAEAEQKLEKQNESLDILISSNDNCLLLIIKEIALFSLAQKQELLYPSKIKERLTAVIALPDKKSIKEFVETTTTPLSDSEIIYLKSNM